MKDNPSLNRYANTANPVEALARGYLNAERLISSEKVPVPKDEQDQEAWERYYKAGGKPEAPDKYEFRKPDSLPDGVTYDENMETWWRQSAHEAGLNKRQAARLYDKYAERFFAQLDLQTRGVGDEVRRGKLELQRDWGNEYEFRRQMATAEFNDMPETLQAHLTQVGLTRNPGFIKYLADARARTTGELEAKGARSPYGSMTPQMVTQKIADFRATHATALSNANHPEHRLRLDEMTRLYQDLYPSSPHE